MPNACRVCDSQHRVAVDKFLDEKRPYRFIAQSFGLTKDGVRRHHVNGHAAGIARKLTPDEEDEQATPAMLMRTALRTLREVDPSKMSPSSVVQHAEAVRKLSESLSKVEAPKEVQKAKVEDVAGMPEFISVLYSVLEAAPCEACGHHNGPGIRDRLRIEMEARGMFAGADR